MDLIAPAHPVSASGCRLLPRAGGCIELREISIVLGNGAASFQAIRNLTCSIAAGEFVSILGPSGCGKSTLLGAIAGHLQAEGDVLLDGIPVTGPHPDRGMVFQQHSLFPWRTVLGNVSFGLKMRRIGGAERSVRAREIIQLVGLDGFADRYPAELSGGMQQRAEIARVLINHPRVVLMDEPFGALDAQTRQRMQELLLDVWARIPTTVVFVTHDIDEALFLADRILVMSYRPGRIREEVAIDFPRPRRAELVTSEGFIRLKRHCLGLLRHESER